MTTHPNLLNSLLHQYHKSHSSFSILFADLPSSDRHHSNRASLASSRMMRILEASKGDLLLRGRESSALQNAPPIPNGLPPKHASSTLLYNNNNHDSSFQSKETAVDRMRKHEGMRPLSSRIGVSRNGRDSSQFSLQGQQHHINNSHSFAASQHSPVFQIDASSNRFQPLIRKTPRGEKSTDAIIQENRKRGIAAKKKRLMGKYSGSGKGATSRLRKNSGVSMGWEGSLGNMVVGTRQTVQYRERNVSEALRVVPEGAGTSQQNHHGTLSAGGESTSVSLPRDLRRFSFVRDTSRAEEMSSTRQMGNASFAPGETVSQSCIVRKKSNPHKQQSPPRPPAQAIRMKLHSPTPQNKLSRHSLHDAWLSANGKNCETIIMDSMHEITQQERPLSSEGVTIAETMDEYQAAIKEWFEREYLEKYDEIKRQIEEDPKILEEVDEEENKIPMRMSTGENADPAVLMNGLDSDDSQVSRFLGAAEGKKDVAPVPPSPRGRAPVSRRYASTQRNDIRIRTAIQDIQQDHGRGVRGGV
uniref:Uncharacterized protein n=1 Tax=Percolomonas cosmopolitus TaxID=63605 RepID=A0A7S1KPY7_9EUKA